jgi:hypothetical protein
MVVVIVGMRVRNPVVGVLMRVRCAGSRWSGRGMFVASVVVGVFVSMRLYRGCACANARTLIHPGVCPCRGRI